MDKKAPEHVLIPSGPGGWSFCTCGYKTGPLGTLTRQRERHKVHKQLAKIEAAYGAQPERKI